ncbi:MAG: hypothetical protein F4087_12405 [Gemmatimonadetes bacterium]|nr:hypothetical protein [Gemmatimonadota bacterium]
MTWRRSTLPTYRGWIVYKMERLVDGQWVSSFSAKPSGELRERFMSPAYWPAPEFGSGDEVRAWVDEDAPYKLDPP